MTKQKNNKQVSKRRRFEIFKRDRFRCQYCGQSPPQVTLEIDHVIPRSSGGDNSAVNLLTSCFDCNRGKSDVPLGQVTPAHQLAIEEGAERLAQLKAFNRLIINERREREKAANAVAEALSGAGFSLANNEMKSISLFLDRLPLSEVLDAVDVVADKGKNWKYFCGICWTKINRGEGDRG